MVDFIKLLTILFSFVYLIKVSEDGTSYSLLTKGMVTTVTEGSGVQPMFKVRSPVPVEKLVISYTLQPCQGQTPVT